MIEENAKEAVLLAALAGELPAQPVPADVSARVREKIFARLAEPSQRVVRAGEGEWQVVLPGISIKRLRQDADSETTLWRMDPGAELPSHAHSQDEECLILEGSLVQGEAEYFPGDFVLALAGRRHASFTSPRGAMFLIRGEPRERLDCAPQA